ncbi:CBS domain-containing protein [Rickettsiales bacterium]|nr:CBS domain-containing protein [Rickettsiales bacterium]
MKICDRPEFKSKKPTITYKENDKVIDAVKKMSKENFGSVVVVDNDHKVKGIVTERDLMKKLLNNGMNPNTTKLKEIMTSPVKVADKDDELVGWLRQMSNERFRHVPVVDKTGKLINIMSQGDFVSYTWPDLIYQVKELAKEGYPKINQLVIICLGVLIYTLILMFAFKNV